MPFVAAPQKKCPKCGKSVYAAEERIAAGYSWHNFCFKCGLCNKMLDSTTAAEHEGSLYCKVCYGRKFGPKGYGFGQGAGSLSMDTGEQFGNYESAMTNRPTDVAPPGGVARTTAGGADICTRCNTTVYAAERRVGGGKNWHSRCFSCAACKKALESGTECECEGEIYCKNCYGRQFGPKGVGFGSGAGSLSMS